MIMLLTNKIDTTITVSIIIGTRLLKGREVVSRSHVPVVRPLLPPHASRIYMVFCRKNDFYV